MNTTQFLMRKVYIVTIKVWVWDGNNCKQQWDCLVPDLLSVESSYFTRVTPCRLMFCLQLMKEMFGYVSSNHLSLRAGVHNVMKGCTKTITWIHATVFASIKELELPDLQLLS